MPMPMPRQQTMSPWAQPVQSFWQPQTTGGNCAQALVPQQTNYQSAITPNQSNGINAMDLKFSGEAFKRGLFDR